MARKREFSILPDASGDGTDATAVFRVVRRKVRTGQGLRQGCGRRQELHVPGKADRRLMTCEPIIANHCRRKVEVGASWYPVKTDFRAVLKLIGK